MSSSTNAGTAPAAPADIPPESSTATVAAASSSSADRMDLDQPQDARASSAPQSQPMTASASASASSEQAVTTEAGTAVIYGTRSRNRGARVNYADDKEIDLEIEASGKYPKPSKKTAPTAQAPTQDADGASARNSVANANSDGAQNAAAPGSTPNGNYSVVPPPASKKRKAPGSGTTATQPPAPTPAAAAPQRPKVSNGYSPHFVETTTMSFSKSKHMLNKQDQLVADDGTIIAVNDHVYFVCEPPGEPYYFGRIMEFLHADTDNISPVDAVRVNWFYRPKDIQRRVQDTRVVFASMHSDTCPLTSMRGKCNIQHLANIDDLDEYRKQPDSFWFDKLYDRYMHRYYEVIPTAKVVNVPNHVKRVLDERWRFVLVEIGRGRDLTSASKKCKRCTDFAANHNSVDCAVCKNTYHMSCVKPPLLKKPARGFAWACAACSRLQEMKMEARHTPNGEADVVRLADAESFDDEDDEGHTPDQITRDSSAGPEAHPKPTEEQLAHANLWPWRYLGIHSRPEDALDYDDRIYPRASSRLGPRHQANMTVWHDRPVEYIKPAEAKKKYKPAGGSKKDAKSAAALENDKRPKRPKWVLDEPPGYIARGSDNPIELKGKKEYTAQLTFRMPDPSKFTERGLDDQPQSESYEEKLDAYIKKCDDEIAPQFHLKAGNVDIRTKAVEKLQENRYDFDKAFAAMQKLSARADLKLPELSKEEIKKFEEGVSKFGSELHAVARFISPNIKESRIVRFYYMWKKTPRGKEIWGTYEGRKSKKDSKRSKEDGTGTKLLQDVGDDADDSAFDNDKAARVKRGFLCKFCNTKHSRRWRRAPATAPGTLVPENPASKNAKDKSNWLVSALCGKCAYLWRRYAIQYESIEEIGKKIAISGGRASKRKIDEELMRIVLEAQSFAGDVITKNTAQIASAAGLEVPAAIVESEEPPKKKPKADGVVEAPVVKKAPEKPIELEPLKPEPPRVKEHPCAVCHVLDDPQHKMLKCRDCRLHVHAACYGVNHAVNAPAWYCDMCKNDHNTQVSTNYECVLCPVRKTQQELMEPPKISHKKKTDREREKERAEREMVQEAGRRWREDQMSAGRPVDPREPLKRTAWNNWVHVNCAVWTKEINFGEADNLDAAEGVGFIPEERFRTPCKLCKDDQNFPTVSCHFPMCTANFHVGCALQAGYTFGFDISPVKVSRRDSVAIMKLQQEAGLAVPGIWCPGHPQNNVIHGLLEPAPSGQTALQEYVRTYKQVDSSVTGTVRRAAQFLSNIPATNGTTQTVPRRSSAMNGLLNGTATNGESISGNDTHASPSPMSPVVASRGDVAGQVNTQNKNDSGKSKKCCTCNSDASPKWWSVAGVTREAPAQTDADGDRAESGGPHASPMSGILNSVQGPAVKAEPIDVDSVDVQKEQQWQCHRCHVQKKAPPSSPSQIRRKEPVIEPVTEAPAPYQPYASGSQSLFAPPRPGLESPAHSHPPTVPNGVAPPAPLQAWSGPAPSWPPPGLADRGQPPPLALYGAPPPPHYRPHEYTYGYRPPGQSPFGLPGPPPPGQMNGLPQHSPPHPAYAHPLHPSHPSSPQVPHGLVGTLPRPFGAEPPRPSDPFARGPFSQPPPPPSVGITRPPSAQSLVQMAQAASDHTAHIHPASRRPSVDERSASARLGQTMESPRAAPRPSAEPPTGPDGNREREATKPSAGPGASASPSLRNLLS